MLVTTARSAGSVPAAMRMRDLEDRGIDPWTRDPRALEHPRQRAQPARRLPPPGLGWAGGGQGARGDHLPCVAWRSPKSCELPRSAKGRVATQRRTNTADDLP